MVGFLLAPVVAKKVIVDRIRQRTGHEATVGEVRCNPLTLSLTIRDFSVPDRSDATIAVLGGALRQRTAFGVSQMGSDAQGIAHRQPVGWTEGSCGWRFQPFPADGRHRTAPAAG
ncbi:MAG: hypothetical protein P8Y93_04990, partial [Acidobacteriota bacterium]